MIIKYKPIELHRHRNKHGVFGYPHPILAPHTNETTKADHDWTMLFEFPHLATSKLAGASSIRKLMFQTPIMKERDDYSG